MLRFGAIKGVEKLTLSKWIIQRPYSEAVIRDSERQQMHYLASFFGV